MGRKGILSVVLDTNVLLGPSRQSLLFLAELGIFRLVWSDFIKFEMRTVMHRLGWSEANQATLFFQIKAIAEWVDYRKITGGNYDEWLHDVDDHPIIATAIAGKADYLVTDNTKDFPPKKRFAEITIITSDAFRRVLK